MANKTLEYLLTIKDEATKSLQNFGKEAQNIGKNLDNVGRSISDAGVGFAKIGAAGVAGLGLATKSAMDFDSQLRNIQSISKMTEAEIQGMGKTFIGLSKTLPQTATQLAEGFYNIQGSGFAGADALKVLDASARAASAGLTTTEASSYAITSALNAYGMSADEAKNVSDTLFKTVDIGVVSFEQLSGTIGDVLGTAANMGVGIDQVGAAIAGMTKKGIGAAEATTSLNATILGFMKPSDQMAESMSALGYESGQAMLAEMDLGQAILAVRKHAEDNGATVNDLFGNVRALKGVLALTGDEAVGFSQDLKAMQGATEGVGATQEAFTEQAKGAAFQAKIFANNLQNIGIIIGNSILPTINSFLAKLTPLIEKFSQFAEKHPKLIVGILALVASFAVFGAILIFVGQMIMAVGAIIPFLGMVATGATAVMGAFGAVLAFLVSPIGLVILAVMALIAVGVLLYKNWDTVKAKASELWSGIKSGFESMVKGISNFGKRIGDSISSGISQGKSSVSNFFTNLASGAQTGITNLFNKIKTIFIGALDLLLKGDFTGEFGRALGLSEDSPIIANVLMFRDMLISAFQTMADGILMALMPAFWIWQNIIFPLLFLAFAIVSRILYEIYNVFVLVFTMIRDTVVTLFTVLWTALVTIFTAIRDWFMITLTALWVETIQPILLIMQEGFLLVWNTIKEFTIMVWTALVEFFTMVWQQIVSIFTSLWNSVVSIFTAIWSSAQAIWSSIWNTIVTFATQIYTTVSQKFESAKAKVISIWEALKNAIRSIGEAIYNAIVEPFIRALRKVEEIASKIKEAARKISPFHKESPSLVELVQSGMGKIKSEYASLNRINIPSAQELAGVPSFGPLSSGIGSTPVMGENNTTTNTINVEATINSEMDAQELAMILGNQLANSGAY